MNISNFDWVLSHWFLKEKSSYACTGRKTGQWRRCERGGSIEWRCKLTWGPLFIPLKWHHDIFRTYSYSFFIFIFYISWVHKISAMDWDGISNNSWIQEGVGLRWLENWVLTYKPPTVSPLMQSCLNHAHNIALGKMFIEENLTSFMALRRWCKVIENRGVMEEFDIYPLEVRV